MLDPLLFPLQVTSQPPGTYSLAGPLYNMNRDKFSITSTGQVILISPLDADYPNGHNPWTLNVVSTKDGRPASPTVLDNDAGYAMINIPVTNTNDNIPEIDTCCLMGYVDEGSPIGITFITSHCT